MKEKIVLEDKTCADDDDDDEMNQKRKRTKKETETTEDEDKEDVSNGGANDKERIKRVSKRLTGRFKKDGIDPWRRSLIQWIRRGGIVKMFG